MSFSERQHSATTGETIVDAVIGALRRSIRDGSLRPGQPLIVPDIAKQLKVSASPVREAIKHLAGAGLVELIPRRAPVIRRLSPAAYREINEAEQALTGFVAKLCAERRDLQTHGLALRSTLDAMREAAATGSPQALQQANERLREVTLEAAGNRPLKEALEHLTLLTAPYRRLAILDPQVMREAVTATELVVEAILAGDPVTAERTMRSHIRAAGEVVMALIADREAAERLPRNGSALPLR